MKKTLVALALAAAVLGVGAAPAHAANATPQTRWCCGDCIAPCTN